MTPRDLAFWIQGCFENGGTPVADTVRKHAQLVLVSEPGAQFARDVAAVCDHPDALRAMVASQFEHVIDKTLPPARVDPAHNPNMLARC